MLGRMARRPRPSEPLPASEHLRPSRRRTLKFPTAFTVLAAVLLLVWVASFFVPAGAYEIDPETAGPVPGTYRELPVVLGREGDELCVETALRPAAQAALDRPAERPLRDRERPRLRQRRRDRRSLYGSAMIFLFVLAVGAFITVTMKTGAIQTGIGRLALRFRHSGSVLIAILMGVFALGGTSTGCGRRRSASSSCSCR